MLIKMRLAELQPSPSPYRGSTAPELAACRESPDWRWRFYAALYRCIADGEGIEAVDELARDGTASAAQRAAAAAMSAALFIESHLLRDALSALGSVLELDDCSPIDHAWLLIQHGRCLADIGDLDRAVEQAVQIQGLRRSHPVRRSRRRSRPGSRVATVLPFTDIQRIPLGRHPSPSARNRAVRHMTCSAS
jgi:hypothetical protein